MIFWVKVDHIGGCIPNFCLFEEDWVGALRGCVVERGLRNMSDVLVMFLTHALYPK